LGIASWSLILENAERHVSRALGKVCTNGEATVISCERRGSARLTWKMPVDTDVPQQRHQE